MKLHLGCGQKYIDGFVHVDLLDFEHIDYQLPIDDLSFADDCTVELIYAAHVLEHTGRSGFKNVLKEWYRVLKPEGILRIAVPDFEACVKHYQKTHKLQDILGLLIGGQKDEYDYHKMIFDEQMLKEALVGIGFKDVKRYDWRKTSHSDIDDFSQAYLPHMQKETGTLMSLNLEAIK
ncbi:MAG: methyltransferase domain-containing protein [Bacteroidetes bacterium]|nr:methyltransferase domain-containing protein [Bacteroidota bacterium]